MVPDWKLPPTVVERSTVEPVGQGNVVPSSVTCSTPLLHDVWAQRAESCMPIRSGEGRRDSDGAAICKYEPSWSRRVRLWANKVTHPGGDESIANIVLCSARYVDAPGVFAIVEAETSVRFMLSRVEAI